MSTLVLKMALCWAAFAGVAAQAQTNIHMRCGATDPYTATFGTVFEGDKSYASSPIPKRGYIGGSNENNVYRTTDGTADATLYRFSRRAMAEYRFDVPPATYAVKLRFNDRRHHGPGMRIFSIVLEGATVQSGIDLVGMVGKDHAIDFTYAVTVNDGILNVAMPATVDAANISAISVQTVTPDLVAPPAPTGAAALGSYSRNILTWDPVTGIDVAGYRVYRAANQGGPFSLLSSQTIRVSRFFDDTATIGVAAWYRVTAIDLWGNESAPSAEVSATALTTAASTLPVYRLTADPADIAFLDQDVYADIYVPAALEVAPQFWPLVEVRYRGGSSRNFHKENWKFNFPGTTPFDGRDKANINAEAGDWTLMREKTAYDLYRAAGIGTPLAKFVHLNINDTFYGVYTDVEQMDQEFLDRLGLDQDGNLYKADSNMTVLPTVGDYVAEYTNESNEGAPIDDLIALIESVNTGSDAEFAVACRRYLDVPKVLDWLAMTILVQDVDSTVHNYFLYNDPASEKWMVFPWDKDICMGRTQINGTTIVCDQPLALGAEGTTPQALGGPNKLVTRLLSFQPFRTYIAQRLQEWIGGIYSPAVMNPIIDANFAAVSFDGRRDVFKLGRQSNTLFDQGPTELKNFIACRGASVLAQIPAFAPSAGPFLTINEYMAANTSTIRDNRNEFEDWIEIYNAGVLPVDLSGMYLTDDLLDLDKWAIPAGTVIPGGGWTLFWADSETNEGPNHTNFRLAAGGESIALVATNGTTIIDSLTFGAQADNVSQWRFPDGTATWATAPAATPNAANFVANQVPVFTELDRTPPLPDSGQPAVVSVLVTDDHGVGSVTLTYNIGGADITVAMLDNGISGDGAPGDGRYGATIPGAPDQAIVTYFMSATDIGALSVRSPLGAPALRHRYRVGYVAPPLVINELMASNASTIADDAGEFDDWIEVHNFGDQPIDLGGMHLSDEAFNPTKWEIAPGTIISPHGFALFWADEDGVQGPTHTSFKLSSGGESVGLYQTDLNANVPIDSITFPALQPDQAFGRTIDAGLTIEALAAPTPLASNNPPPPPCPCDWNQADGLDSQDFFDFLDSFFNGDADFNNADGTDSQDFFDFLDCFFTGCP